MENSKLMDIIFKVLTFILVIGAIAGVLFIAMSQLKKLEFKDKGEVAQTTVVAEPVKENVSEPKVDEKAVVENATVYSDNITDVLFTSQMGDYAILLSLDPTLMMAKLTNIDTDAKVIYKDAISTTIAQSASLDESTFKKICLAATGKTEIDYFVKLSDEDTGSLISFMREEEHKDPVDTSIFSGEDLGTLFLDEFVDFSNCKQLSFDSLSKLWSNLTAYSGSEIKFNKLSEIILALKSYSLKRNWERLVFEPVVEETAVEEAVVEEPIAEVVEEPVEEEIVIEEPAVEETSFAFTQTNTVTAEEIFATANYLPSTMNLEDAAAQAVVSVPQIVEEPVAETVEVAEPEKVEPIKKVKTISKNKSPKYFELSAGFGYSYGKDSKESGWERDLSTRLEIGKKITSHFNVFGSIRVIRNSEMSDKDILSQYAKSYTIIPGIGFSLNAKHIGLRGEFNGHGIVSEWKFNCVDYRMGATLIPYVSIPLGQKVDLNIDVPATISFKRNAYKLSGALSLGLEYTGK